LRSRSDLARVFPAGITAATGPGTIGPSNAAAAGFAEFWTLDHRFRFRLSGPVTQIKVGGPTSKTGQSFSLRIWRLAKAAGRYDLVDQTGDLISLVTANAVSTITLPTPLTVEEGDYLGYRIDGTGTAFWPGLAFTGGRTYFLADTTPPNSYYPWGINSFTQDVVLPIECWMPAPQLVAIGDSLISGHPLNKSFLDSQELTSLPDTIHFNLHALIPRAVNHGHGGDSTATIQARFQTDVVDLKPRYCLMEGGINAVDTLTVAQQVANFQSMLTACQTNQIIALVLSTLPWTTGTNAQNQKIDQLNSQVQALMPSFPGARFIDGRATIGQFRVGGDPGNLWDIQAPYDSGDGTHLTSAGYAQVAAVVASAITA